MIIGKLLAHALGAHTFRRLSVDMRDSLDAIEESVQKGAVLPIPEDDVDSLVSVARSCTEILSTLDLNADSDFAQIRAAIARHFRKVE